MMTQDTKKENLTVIVQLGGPNESNGNLSDIVIARCNKTLALAADYPNAKILCTGGKNEHFNPCSVNHSELTQRYLVNQGLNEARFLPPALSRYTIEDAALSLPILNALAIKKLILVTSSFHMQRALHIFNHFFPLISIEPQPADNTVNGEVLEKLERHELFAIQRDLKTLTTLQENK